MTLLKNSLWNIGGYVIPAIVTVPALGIMGRILGAELFGVFTLALAVVGYASIFDAGLTRAVIREISIFRDDQKEKLRIVATATVLILILGMVAGCLLLIFSNAITTLLKISSGLHHEVSIALKILSLSIPLFLITQVWLSILEGMERFGVLNIYKSITGTLLSLLPAVFILIQPSLEFAIMGLVVARFLCFVIAFILCRTIIIDAGLLLHRKTVKRLFMFGGWITVSNIVSPIMAYFDRFIVSNQLGAQVVAFYTAPSEIIARLSIIPGAFARALFPRLSYATNAEERRKTKIFISLILLVICIPAIIIGSFFANSIMTIWMGPSFAGTPGIVLTILLIGFLFNSLAQVPFASIQSRGHAKVTAMVHLAELFPYLFLLFFLINNYGIIGAAFAWSIRMFVDYISLAILDRKFSA